MGTFGVKRASDEPFCPSTVGLWKISQSLLRRVLDNA